MNTKNDLISVLKKQKFILVIKAGHFHQASRSSLVLILSSDPITFTSSQIRREKLAHFLIPRENTLQNKTQENPEELPFKCLRFGN